MSTINFWRARYRQAFERAAHATALPGRVACGFTNNVDHIADVDGPQFSRLLEQQGVPLPNDRGPTLVRTPDELLAAMAALIRQGHGGELTVLDSELYRWVEEHFAFRGAPQLGGTAAQAAQTLSLLGFATLLHVTSLSPAQAALLDGSGRLRVATADGLLPPGAAARPNDPTMVHVIFEYAAGTRVEAGGEWAAAPEANRIIVSYDPVNNELVFDPLYADAVADPAEQVGAVLLSGYNQVSTIGLCRRRIAETVALIRRWKAARPRLLTHLELGGTPDAEYLAAILDGFAGEVESVGLNADEVNDVLRLWGKDHAGSAADLTAAAQEMQSRLACVRLNVHTQNLCVTVTRGDPREEQDALLFGSLAAGTRARLAAFPQRDDLTRVLDEAEIAPAGQRMLTDALAAAGATPEGVARLDEGWLVVTPTLAVANPAGLVGLGDSFTAGVLGILAAGRV